jgi:hypothetical protein
MLKTANARTEKKIIDRANNEGTKNFLPSSFELINSYIKRKAIKIKVPISVLEPIINPVLDAIVEDAMVEDAIADEAMVDEAMVDDSMLDNISFSLFPAALDT